MIAMPMVAGAFSALLMLAFVKPGPVAAQSVACSFSAFGMYRLDAMRFVGTATADTVPAGRGTGPAPNPGRETYGQVFRVEAADSVFSANLEKSSTPGSTEVVLVPWGMTDRCSRPIPWRLSARWVPSGTRGLYYGRARERAQWVGDRPTFDIWVPELFPYPSGRIVRGSLRDGVGALHADRDSTILTADELLTLYEALPASEQLATGPTARAAIEPLIGWMRAHPDLAERRPAPMLIMEALYRVEDARRASIRSPLAGTYRFMFTLPSGERTTIFTRTEEVPTSGLSLPGVGPEPIAGTRWEIPRTAGYYLLSQSAAGVDGLPRTRNSDSGQGYLALIENPLTTGPDSTTWRGSLDLIHVASDLAGDVIVGAKIRSVAVRVQHLGIAATTTGTWVLDRARGVRFDWVVRDGDSALITVRGERLSVDLLSPP